ncbi:MAG: hypothetical protein ACXVJD_06765 [Mucilaginibacter sp.]
MKTNRILSALLLSSALLSACGHKSSNGAASSADSTSTTKADTAIKPGDQKSVKNDSVSGDPASKGSVDPNAKLPKK